MTVPRIFGTQPAGNVPAAYLDEDFASITAGTTPITNATAIATGGTSARTLAAHFADILAFEDFGAVGDGTTDDAVAIQAAFTYAATNSCSIHMAAKTYACGAAITLSSAGSVDVYGNGEASRILFNGATGGFNFILRAYDAGTGVIDRCYMMDFQILAGAVFTSAAIKAAYTSHVANAEASVLIRNVQVRPAVLFGTNKFAKGFHGDKIYTGLLERFTFIGATAKSDAGIYFNNCISVNMENPDLTYCTAAVHITTGDGGVAQEDSEGFHIQSAIMVNVTKGVVVDGLSSAGVKALDVRVIDSHINSDQEAISFDTVYQSAVIGCLIYTETGTKSGIVDLSGLGNVYSGNQLINLDTPGSPSVGIDLQGIATSSIISGNWINRYDKPMKFGGSTQSNQSANNTCIGNTNPIDNTGTTNQDMGNVFLDINGVFQGISGYPRVFQDDFADLQAAWVSYTPVAAVGSGSITTLGTVQGGVKAFGKTVTVRIDVTVTTAGTAGTSLSFTLPAASISGPQQVLVGREVGSTNKALTGWIQSNSSVAFVNLYDGSFYIADGARYILEGTYEVA